MLEYPAIISIFLLLADTTPDSFLRHPDFWIAIGVAIIGIIISWFAFRDARRAFRKAEKASKTVKKQSIIISISETIRLCQIRGNTNYEDSNSKLMEINGKVRNIMGLYRDELAPSHNNLLQLIESCSSDALTQFNLLDPNSENKDIYNKMRPYMTDLTGHLNELQGVLEKEIIYNN
jgi:hypothetical protein